MIYNMFVGTYADENGLYDCIFDSETGMFDLKGTIDIKNPSYLCKHGDTLFGVSETDTFNGKNGGAVFSVAIQDGRLSEITSIYGTNGKSPCHLCVHDNLIFVSNYGEGTLSVFMTDGKLLHPSFQSLAHYGDGVKSSRQEKPHIHFSGITPDKRFLAVCDLGLDMIAFYPYSKEYWLSLKCRPLFAPPGSGPRHLAFSKNEEDVYVLTELDSTILTYKYHTGICICAVPSSPNEGDSKNYASAIKMSDCGNYLCVSNRGDDLISVFNISEGSIPVFERAIPTGKYPRDFCFSPDGRWIISANQKDNSISSHLFDGDSIHAVNSIIIPSPTCVVFN